jgi:hypothetical protein
MRSGETVNLVDLAFPGPTRVIPSPLCRHKSDATTTEVDHAAALAAVDAAVQTEASVEAAVEVAVVVDMVVAVAEVVVEVVTEVAMEVTAVAATASKVEAGRKIVCI